MVKYLSDREKTIFSFTYPKNMFKNKQNKLITKRALGKQSHYRVQACKL